MTASGKDREQSNWEAWFPVFGGLFWYTEGSPRWAVGWVAPSFLNSNNSAPLKIRKIIYRSRCQDLESRHLGIHGRKEQNWRTAFRSAGMHLKSVPLFNSLGRPPWSTLGRPRRFLCRERLWAAGRAPGKDAESPPLEGGMGKNAPPCRGRLCQRRKQGLSCQ